MKRKSVRIVLNRETLRHLDTSNLSRAAGQTAGISQCPTCGITMCGLQCSATIACTDCNLQCSVGC
jgi:hypothetical protein